MKDNTDNQVPHWTDDPAQQEEFFVLVEPTINREAVRWTDFQGVAMDREDIASKRKLELWEQMGKRDADGPFAKATPKETADSLIADYKIREPIRWDARKLGGTQRKEAKSLAREFKRTQAEVFAGVRPKDLPQGNILTNLFNAAGTIRRLSSETPGFTPRDNDIFGKETLRQVGVDDAPPPIRDQIARAAGISSVKLSTHLEYHDEYGHCSESDRTAYGRACAKVRKAFPRDKFKSLLMIVLALGLSLGSYAAIRDGRSIYQKNLVNHGSCIRPTILAHQENLAFAHQENLIDQIALAHQEDLIGQNSLAHQENLIVQNALGHQPT
jgi:hypothetical protein